MMRPLGRRIAVISIATVMAVTAGCGSDSSGEDDSPDSEVIGCGFVPKSALSAALGSDSLSSTGSDEPDPETKLTSCTTTSTLKTGVSAHVEVSDATAASLAARDNWRSESPEANPGCIDPSFIDVGDLGGVACIETAAQGQATRLYVVSPRHIITVTLALAGEAAPEDTDAALTIAQAVEKHLG